MVNSVEPVVQAVGLTKVFRDFWGRPKAKAVNDIDFEIHHGEVIGLLGPNGSGKSTTVKMLLGLLYPTGGKLTVYGKSPRAVETKREIGYLPEETYLYRYLTAEETLDFFGSLFNLSAEDRRRRIDQLLEMVGLEHARRRRVGEFSKGMARRIGIAQAMINDPSLLILDEPTSGLDPLGCREVKDLILALKKRGKTIVVTSHLLSDIEDVCDRVIILYGGKIRAEGTLDSLLTVSDSNRITTPVLPPETMEKVLSILRESLHGDNFKVDNPRRTLEEFFLDVVAKARAESIETAGVAGGGHIADYLTVDNSETNAVLAALVNEQNSDSSEPEKSADDDTPVPAEDKSDITERLAELTADTAIPEAPAETGIPQKSEDEKLEAANARLNDLLGTPEKKL